MSRQKKNIDRVGSFVRNERKKNNLLLRQASALLEIDQALLSKIERNERNATKEQVLNFAKVYNIDEDELLIMWLTEKVIRLLLEEDNGLKILNVVENKLKTLEKEKRLREEASD